MLRLLDWNGLCVVVVVLHLNIQMTACCVFQFTVEPPLTDILYSGHLIIQDRKLWSEFEFALRVIQLSKMWTPRYSVKRTPRYSVKRTNFCGPASTWTVQNSLDDADAGRSLAQDCSAPLIDSPPDVNSDDNNTFTWATSNCSLNIKR